MNQEQRAYFRHVNEEIRKRYYQAVEFLAVRGLHAKAIAKFVGVSHWHVYGMCRQMQIKLRDYRDGLGPIGSTVASEGAKLAPPKRRSKKS